MFLKRQEHQGVLIGTNGFFNGFIACEENLHNICYLSNVLKIAEAKLSRHLSRGFFTRPHPWLLLFIGLYGSYGEDLWETHNE